MPETFEQRLDRLAAAILDVDEDVADETASAMAAQGDRSLLAARAKRPHWQDLSLVRKQRYRRLARAAIAAQELWLGAMPKDMPGLSSLASMEKDVTAHHPKRFVLRPEAFDAAIAFGTSIQRTPIALEHAALDGTTMLRKSIDPSETDGRRHECVVFRQNEDEEVRVAMWISQLDHARMLATASGPTQSLERIRFPFGEQEWTIDRYALEEDETVVVATVDLPSLDHPLVSIPPFLYGNLLLESENPHEESDPMLLREGALQELLVRSRPSPAP